MKLRVTGIDHQTTPVLIREKTAISGEKLPYALLELRRYIHNGVILSTCNRTEIYSVESDAFNAKKAVLGFISNRAGVHEEELMDHIYQYKDKKAAEHLFRVASGLESMVVGEYEILGQVRDAVDAAETRGMVNLPLRQLFNSALSTGRKVRTETGISRNALSVSSIALDFAARVAGNLSDCSVLVIGTGEAGKLVARVARERGIKNLTIASRTRERALRLAGMLDGRATGLENVTGELEIADIVITCAGAPHWLLKRGIVEQSMRNRSGSPLVIIDIALPRNVEPSVADIPYVFLYNIDDLNRVSDENRQQRQMEIHNAESIISTEIDVFINWWKQYLVRPTVAALMSRAEHIRLNQFNRTLQKLPPLSDEQVESLNSMTRSIVNKILRDPVHFLKTSESSNQIMLIREIFRLDGDE